MTTTLAAPPPTADEAARRLGVQPFRIRLTPYPATEDDVLAIKAREGRLFELDDGVLVEKAMSYESGYVAATLITLLRNYVRPQRLGAVNGPDGMMKLVAGMVRMPDVSFIPWTQFPGGRVPKTPVPLVPPCWRSRCSARTTPGPRSTASCVSTSPTAPSLPGW